MLRYLTLPDAHPLHQVIKRVKRNPPEKHLGPLDQLVKIFKLGRTTFETIESAPQFPAEAPQINTTIERSREDSISFELNDTADFKAFSAESEQQQSYTRKDSSVR
jgi:hypothetical protein